MIGDGKSAFYVSAAPQIAGARQIKRSETVNNFCWRYGATGFSIAPARRLSSGPKTGFEILSAGASGLVR